MEVIYSKFNFRYLAGTLSVSQTPLSEIKNSNLSLNICWDSTKNIWGFPCRCPTFIAVSLSILRWTCCLFLFSSPVNKIDSTDVSPVPWYSTSGGSWFEQPSSISMECPWLALILSKFSVNAKRFFEFVATICLSTSKSKFTP